MANETVPGGSQLAQRGQALFWSSMVWAAASIVVSFASAATLGPTGRGTLAALMAVPSILTAFGAVGVHVAAPIWVARGRLTRREAVMITLLTCAVVSGFLDAGILAYGFDGLGKTVMHAAPPELIRWTVLATPLALFAYVAYAVLPALGYLRAAVLIRLAHSVVYAVPIAIAAVIGVLSIEVAYGFYLIGLSLVFVGYVAGSQIWRVPRRGVYPLVPGLLLLGARTHVGSLAQHLVYRLDLLVVAALLPSEQIGVYAVAVAIAELVWYVPDSIVPLLLGGLPTATQRAGAVLTGQAIRAGVVAAAFVALVLLVGATALLPRILPAFAAANAFLWLLLVAAIAHCVYRLGAIALAARGRTAAVAATSGAAAIASIALYPAAVRLIGVYGAAAATTLIYAGEALALAWLLGREFDVSAANLIMPRRTELKLYLTSTRRAVARRLAGTK